MTIINIRLSDTTKRLFEMKVGKGRMSEYIRHYIESIVSKEDDIDIQILQKEFQAILKQKEEIDSKHLDLKTKLDAIASEKEIQELDRLKKEKELKEKLANIKYDTIRAHLGDMIK